WCPGLEAIRKVWIALTYGSHGYYPIFTEVSPMTTPIRKPYLTDLTDDQWHILQPLIPPAKPGGRPRAVDMREIINTILYLNRTGCQWDMLPHDLIPKSTVYEYFTQWRDNGTGGHLSAGRAGIATKKRYAFGFLRQGFQRRPLPDAMPTRNHTRGSSRLAT